MKEKQRPTITSGLESIEEEFKNLQTKDVISRFTNELDTKEGQDKFMAHLQSTNQGNEISLKHTQAEQINLLEEQLKNRQQS